MRKAGHPSRFSRFCCAKLKEYKVCDIAIHGIRRSESRARAERYHEPQVCRIYNKSKNQRVSVFLPILEWTDEDVAEYIEDRGIKCAPVYYDEEGKFHVERRLGCICCPMASRRKRLEEFHRYPKMVRQYIVNTVDFFKGEKKKKFNNAIDAFVSLVYFDNYDDFCEKTYTMFGKYDWRTWLENEYNINLQDIPYDMTNKY